MTVGELMEVSPFCELLEVIIRKEGHGQWIYGYRIGKDVEIYPAEYSAEIQELRSLKEYTPYNNKQIVKLKDGDVFQVTKEYMPLQNDLKMEVICKDVHTRLPKKVADLEVSNIVPRTIHVRRPQGLSGDWVSSGHEFELWCYPPEQGIRIETRQQASKPSEIEDSGQMTIEDLMRANR